MSEEKNTLEDPAFPPEFLDVMSDYAYQKLYDHLEVLEVDQAALDLLDDLMTLKVSEIYMQAEEVKPHFNEATAEAVAAISRNVVKLGGVFFGPNDALIGVVSMPARERSQKSRIDATLKKIRGEKEGV
jgi:hypothetical protein